MSAAGFVMMMTMTMRRGHYFQRRLPGSGHTLFLLHVLAFNDLPLFFTSDSDSFVSAKKVMELILWSLRILIHCDVYSWSFKGTSH